MEFRVHLPRSARGRRAFLSALVLGVSLGASVYLVGSSSDVSKRAAEPLIVAPHTSRNLDFTREITNLTQEFTEESVKTLIAENEALKEQGAPANAYATLPDSPDVAAIVSSIIDRELAAERVALADLKTASSNSPDTQRAYLFFVNEVIETQGREMPQISRGSLPAYFTATAEKLEETAEILKALKAPPSWLPLHRDLVAFFVRQANIYRSLGAAEDDPLRFLIAATRLLPAEAEREFLKLRSAIEGKMKDEKLI